MAGDDLTSPFERLLESGPDWSDFEASGFLDALMPEEAGGAGLTLADVGPLIAALGRHACALPVADTMVGRALLARAGEPVPRGPLALSSAARSPAYDADGLLVLWDSPRLTVSAVDALAAPAGGLRAIGAVIAASELAGVAERLVEMSVAYANDRVQFGRPIGKLQVMQQMLSVMAEQALMVRTASRFAWAAGLEPSIEIAAVAKHAASAAVETLTSTAHAVHGAIGVTEAFSLQAWVKRAYRLGAAHGSAGYWAEALGRARLAHADTPSLDYVRALTPG